MQSLRQAAGIKPPEQEPETKVGFGKKFKSFLKSMLSDSHDDNAISSKRVIALIAFICCVIAFFVDIFTDNQVTQGIFDSMMWIVVAGLGFTGLEKFASKE